MLLLVCAGAALLLHFGFRQFYQSAYPMKYESLIKTVSEEKGLDPAFVFAVAHTESGFHPEAQSSVGARGLMQMTPDAYDWIRMRRGLPPVYDKDILFDPETNVDYGAAMLALLLEEFGSEENALCAYHAGRGRVQKWLQNPAYAPDGMQVTEIPFADTRAYVKKVCETKAIYQKLYGL